ncbi:MAG: 5-(carboxyamino)imidazole ribonucleotide mutase [Bacteroidetes bacterium]|nr:5-(carboxyamino)imidazole ribonucleotide mutase [Bacteroidota bacterium]
MKNAQVAIIMGSDSDLPVMQEAASILTEFGVAFEMTIVSAHRTPKRMYEFAENAEKSGIKIIIAGAGGAAHLPGMVASITKLPVIGVPVQSKYLSGIDSLYSIAQMPPGVPVATMAINGAKNAGLTAIRILALNDKTISKKLEAFINKQTKTVLEKAEKMKKGK